MKFTDKEALKIFKSIKCYELKESIESYPEDERDGKTDLIIIRDEIDYYAYIFEYGARQSRVNRGLQGGEREFCKES